MKINDETREAVRKAVGDQLGAGVGTAEMPCVMAAVSLALGEGYQDAPSCVHAVDRAFATRVNGAGWSSPEARARGTLPLALASLGTAGTDRAEWVRRVVEGTIRRVVPMALRAAGLEAEAARCEREGTAASAVAYAAYAARAANASANAAAYALDTALAAYAANAAADAVLLVAVDVAVQAYGVGP